jgi:hypothetical protein
MEQPTGSASRTAKQRIQKHVRPLLGMSDQPTIVKTDPDPTTATKEYVKAAVEAAVAPIKQQITSGEKAVELLAAKQAQEPQASQVSSDVAHLKELCLNKFSDQSVLFDTITTDFEKLVAKQNELNDKALKAAFDASSQVVQTAQVFNDRASTKAEASSDNRMQEMTSRLTLVSEGLTDKIQALDKRMTGIESNRQGLGEYRTESRLNMNSLIAWIVAAAAVVGLLIKYTH